MGRIRETARRLAWRAAKLMSKWVLYGHLAMCAGMYVSNQVRREAKTAVLVSDAGAGGRNVYYPQSIGIAFAIYPWVTLFENAAGYQTEWHLHATRSDLESTLDDKRVQSEITIGHGARGYWYSSDADHDDRQVWNHHVRAMMTEQKTGHWLQLSCGENIGAELGTGVMPRDHLRAYNGIIQFPWAIFYDAVRGFPVLNGRKSPDEGIDYILLARFLDNQTIKELGGM